MNDFINYLTPVLADVLGALLSALCGYLIIFIHKKKDNISRNEYLDMLASTVEKCVRATNQTYVDALKKDNIFTKEAQEEAFNRTIENVKSILNEDCIKYLNKITDDLDKYLKNAIESSVAWNKDL